MKLQQVLVLLCLAVIFVSVNSDSVAFTFIGSFQKDRYTKMKSYYLPRYFHKHNWFEAAHICRTFNMSLATFDSIDEFNAVQIFLKYKLNLMSDYAFVGGVANTAKSRFDWYWAETNKRIPFTMQWEANQPDNCGNEEWCLAIGKTQNSMLFNDVSCYTPRTFLCDIKLYY